MAFSVSYIYEIHDKYSRAIRKINAGTNKFKKNITTTQSKIKGLSSRMTSLQNVIGGVGLGMATLFPVKKAIDFESVMADVSKVIDLTPKQFQNLRKQIFASSVAMGRIPTQTARIAEAAGKLNIPINQMGKFIEIISRTAVAFDILEETVGKDVGSMKAKLKLSIDDVERLMDSINYLADNTSAQGGRMIQIIGRISGVMSTVQMTPELVAGWAAFADQIEVTPMLAASGIRQVINKMKTMPGMMEKLLEDPSKTITTFLRRFEKIEPAKRAGIVLKVFGNEAGRFAEKAINNLDLLDSTLQKVSDSSKAAGSMLRELQKKMATAEFKINQARASMWIMAITIGESLLPLIKLISPYIIKAAKSLGNFAKAHPTIMRTILIVGLITTALISVTVVLGALAAAVAFLLPVVGYLAGAFAFLAIALKTVVAIGGLIAMILGSPLTILVALIAAVAVLHKKFEILNAPVEMFKDLLEKIKNIDFLSTLKTGLDYAKNLVGLGANIIVNKEVNTKGSINGSIKVSADRGSQIEETEMSTDMPGNLGFNMVGSH